MQSIGIPPAAIEWLERELSTPPSISTVKGIFTWLCPTYLTIRQVIDASEPMMGREHIASTYELWAALEWSWQPAKICQILMDAIKKANPGITIACDMEPDSDGARSHHLLIRRGWDGGTRAYYVSPSYADQARDMFKICVSDVDSGTCTLTGMETWGAYNDLETTEKEFYDELAKKRATGDELREVVFLPAEGGHGWRFKIVGGN